MAKFLDKKALRKDLIKKREKIPDKEIKSHEIFEKLRNLNEWKDAKIINTYVSLKEEVDTRFIIYHALLEGKRVFCPITKGENLIFGEIFSFNDLIYGACGILEPKEPSNISIDEFDLIIVPGIAFDRSGYRIGYGKGYCDRFLKDIKRGIKIGLVFDDLLLDSLSVEEHDEKVDIIITEGKIIKLR